MEEQAMVHKQATVEIGIPRTETLDARDIALSLVGAGPQAALNVAGIGAAATQGPPDGDRALACVFLS